MLEALHDDKSEQIMTVFCAASWFPQNKKFFLDKAIGRIAFSARLSKSFDNPVENSIRPLALGRKNYLFCGNDDAADNAAVIYSLMGCCKAGEVNLREWLVYVLENIHASDNDYGKNLAELLPHNWKANNSQKL